jgi:DNA-binding NtrC family response regulator
MRSFPQVVEKSPTLRVLVVEDELLIRWSITETLAHAGHVVIEAEDGATAVRALTDPAEPVDAVLLDYRLPDSNDLTLLANIRRLSPQSPVIMMTAYGTPEVTSGALELGVYQVMSKPFELGDLEALLLAACGSRPGQSTLSGPSRRISDKASEIRQCPIAPPPASRT